jgi:hypothetical protein
MKAGSAGSGTIDLSADETYENTSVPGDITLMSGSAQDRTVTVQAPASGGGGSSSGGSSGGSGATNSDSNPTTNPNSQSNVAVPGSETDTSAPAEVVPETELAAMYEEQNSSTDTNAAVTVTKKGLPILALAVPVGLILLGAGVYFAFRWRQARSFTAAVATPPIEAGSQIPPAQTPPVSPSPGEPGGPTIIKPQG